MITSIGTSERISKNRGEEYGRIEKVFYEQIGWLDHTLPVLETRNETSIKAVAGPQINPFYGVLLRSTLFYFVSDDHDYYENDDATDKMVTLPPDRYQLEFARFTSNAYLPGFLADRERPLLMSGTGAGDRAAGISESFRTFSYGRLVETLIYDRARYLSLKGLHAGLVPPEVERWLPRPKCGAAAAHTVASLWLVRRPAARMVPRCGR